MDTDGAKTWTLKFHGWPGYEQQMKQQRCGGTKVLMDGQPRHHGRGYAGGPPVFQTSLKMPNCKWRVKNLF